MDALDELLGTPTLAGHNRPDPLEILRDELEAENHELIKRKDQLLAGAGRMPETVEDDEAAGKFADMVKLVTAATKAADAARVARKEPFLEGGRAVDGFFKSRIGEPLEKAKKTIEGRLSVYLRAKAERERAERLRQEAEARRAADEAAAAARKAEQALRDERSLEEAIAAQRRADDAKAAATAAAKAAAAKPAEMSRTRGDAGALGSLRTWWDLDPATIDRAALDLEALRQHLPVDAIEKAVRSFIKAGGRELRGVHIYERKEARVS